MFCGSCLTGSDLQFIDRLKDHRVSLIESKTELIVSMVKREGLKCYRNGFWIE